MDEKVKVKTEVTEKQVGQVTVQVKTDGLDALLDKSAELVQTLEKAKTLSNELAQINFIIN